MSDTEESVKKRIKNPITKVLQYALERGLLSSRDAYRLAENYTAKVNERTEVRNVETRYDNKRTGIAIKELGMDPVEFAERELRESPDYGLNGDDTSLFLDAEFIADAYYGLKDEEPLLEEPCHRDFTEPVKKRTSEVDAKESFLGCFHNVFKYDNPSALCFIKRELEECQKKAELYDTVRPRAPF